MILFFVSNTWIFATVEGKETSAPETVIKISSTWFDSISTVSKISSPQGVSPVLICCVSFDSVERYCNYVLSIWNDVLKFVTGKIVNKMANDGMEEDIVGEIFVPEENIDKEKSVVKNQQQRKKPIKRNYF